MSGGGTVVAEGSARLEIVEGAEGGVTVVGPDGKKMTLRLVPEGTEGARVVLEDGRTILVFGEGKEGGKGEKEEDEKDEDGEGHEGAKPAAPAASDPRGYLGFSPVPIELLSPEARAHAKVTAQHGVVALRVYPGSPAEKAGLKDGDVILQYAGQDVPPTKDLDPSKPEGVEAFTAAFAKVAGTTRPGIEIGIVVERDGKPVTLRATPIDLAAMKKIAAAAGEDDEDDGEDEADEAKEKEGAAKPEAPEKVPAPK